MWQRRHTYTPENLCVVTELGMVVAQREPLSRLDGVFVVVFLVQIHTVHVFFAETASGAFAGFTGKLLLGVGEGHAPILPHTCSQDVLSQREAEVFSIGFDPFLKEFGGGKILVIFLVGIVPLRPELVGFVGNQIR